MARNRITGRETQKMQEYTQERIAQAERRDIEFSTDVKEQIFEYANLIGEEEKVRPLINDFLRKMAKFRHQENQDVSAGTRIRFFIDKPAAMISFPRAVIKYL